jgi:adenosylcobinamide kinase/adenosylcobinamide-phosphate guanylyltransferase
VYFVTGGAFQGKRKWVTQYLSNHPGAILWINGYKQEDLDSNWFKEKDVVVIEGMEDYIQHSLETKNRDHWKSILLEWQDWEKEKPSRLVIIVGCEVGLGIVPMEKRDREWRDMVGWVYQDIAAHSTNVVRLWCGIAETLKEDKRL